MTSLDEEGDNAIGQKVHPLKATQEAEFEM
jgi:hypothetical protein